MLARLRDLLYQEGRLSGFLIDEAEDMPSRSAYAARFGSLPRANALIGWSPGRDYSYLEINRKMRAQHNPLVREIVEQLRATYAVVVQDERTDPLTINSEYSAALVLARCQKTPAGSERWIVRFDAALNPDITIAARLRPGSSSARPRPRPRCYPP